MGEQEQIKTFDRISDLEKVINTKQFDELIKDLLNTFFNDIDSLGNKSSIEDLGRIIGRRDALKSILGKKVTLDKLKKEYEDYSNNVGFQGVL